MPDDLITKLIAAIDGLRGDLGESSRAIRSLIVSQQRVTADLTAMFRDFHAELEHIRSAMDRADRITARLDRLDMAISESKG